MKNKFYIVYDYEMTNEINMPSPWGSFPHAITSFLKEELKVGNIGSEITWIIDYNHRSYLINTYNVSDKNIDDYLKSSCHIFSFYSKGTRKRAIKLLEKMGCTKFTIADNYRDVIIKQAYFFNKNEFY